MVVVAPVVTVHPDPRTFPGTRQPGDERGADRDEPRRVRVVAAKVLSGIVLSLLGSAYALAAAAGALALSDSLGRQVTWHLPWRYVIGFLTFVLLNSLLGMAFGALLLNTPAAIVLFFVLPTIWTLISYGWLEKAGR